MPLIWPDSIVQSLCRVFAKVMCRTPWRLGPGSVKSEKIRWRKELGKDQRSDEYGALDFRGIKGEPLEKSLRSLPILTYMG